MLQARTQDFEKGGSEYRMAVRPQLARGKVRRAVASGPAGSDHFLALK